MGFSFLSFSGDEQSFPALWDHSDRCRPQPGWRHSALHHRGFMIYNKTEQNGKRVFSLSPSLLSLQSVSPETKHSLSTSQMQLSDWIFSQFFIPLSVFPWCFRVIARLLNYSNFYSQYLALSLLLPAFLSLLSFHFISHVFHSCNYTVPPEIPLLPSTTVQGIFVPHAVRIVPVFCVFFFFPWTHFGPAPWEARCCFEERRIRSRKRLFVRRIKMGS